MIKVAKFGGTSVADSKQFRKVHDIIENDTERKFVVVSAPGKRFKDDNKITDLLYLTHAHTLYTVPYEQVFGIIENRFITIRDELNLSVDIERELSIIREKLDSKCDVDYLVSRGEYLNALLMAAYLECKFVDAKDVIFFNYDGNVNDEKTDAAMKSINEKYDRVVIPGFYGALPDGTIKTFSRGGSDITGAIVAKAVEAYLYENWTDVSGFLMADPRIVKNSKQIKKITYKELRELSYMGATVLHDEAIFPVREAKIPINIKNTNEPSNPGTIIVDQEETEENFENPYIITGISGKKNFTVFYAQKEHMANEVGTLRTALEIFAKRNISIEHIPSGIDSFSLVVPTESVEKSIYEISEELKTKCELDVVKVYGHMSLITTVGNNMAFKPGISAKLFTALGNNNINIRMINQGSSEINIIVGVEDKDFEKAIKAIYAAFVEQKNKEN